MLKVFLVLCVVNAAAVVKLHAAVPVLSISDLEGGIRQRANDAVGRLVKTRSDLQVSHVTSEPSEELVKKCKDLLEKSFGFNALPPVITMDFWEAESHADDMYKLRSSLWLIPDAASVHCIHVDIALAVHNPTSERSVDTFLLQNPDNDNTWTSDNPVEDKSDLSGTSPMAKLVSWMHDSAIEPTMGIRWFRVEGKREDGSMEYTPDSRVNAVVIKRSYSFSHLFLLHIKPKVVNENIYCFVYCGTRGPNCSVGFCRRVRASRSGACQQHGRGDTKGV